MKNFFTYVCVALIIAGSAVCYFSTIPLVDCLAISATSFGLTGLIVKTTKKASKLTWKEYVSVGLFTVVGICAYLANMQQEVVSKIATAVVGLIALVAGIIVIKKKE